MLVASVIAARRPVGRVGLGGQPADGELQAASKAERGERAQATKKEQGGATSLASRANGDGRIAQDEQTTTIGERGGERAAHARHQSTQLERVDVLVPMPL